MSNISIELDNCQKEVDGVFLPRRKKAYYLSTVYEELGLFSNAEKVRSCGSFLEFHVDALKSKLYFANFCKDRLCPMCNWRRSLKIFLRVSKVMDELELQGYRFLFLTLTVRNCSGKDLKKTTDTLLKAYTKLLRRASVKRAVHGTYRAFEVTYSENKFWHPHLHAILAVKEEYFQKDSGLYLTIEKWRDLWAKSCEADYRPFVWIEAVKKGKLDFVEGDLHTISFKSAVKEVAKYVCKSDGRKGFLKYDLKEDAARVKDLSGAIMNHRLNQFTGVFLDVARQMKLEDLECADLVHVDDTIRPDLYQMIVRYRWKSGAYVKEVFDYSEAVKEKSIFTRKGE